MSFKEFRKMWHKAYWFYAGIYTAVGCVIAAIAWHGFLSMQNLIRMIRRMSKKEARIC